MLYTHWLYILKLLGHLCFVYDATLKSNIIWSMLNLNNLHLKFPKNVTRKCNVSEQGQIPLISACRSTAFLGWSHSTLRPSLLWHKAHGPDEDNIPTNKCARINKLISSLARIRNSISLQLILMSKLYCCSLYSKLPSQKTLGPILRKVDNSHWKLSTISWHYR